MPAGRIAATLLLIAAGTLGAQPSPFADGSIPKTGLDFSGADALWPVVDALSTDTEPTEEQWRTLLGTPGYRMAQLVLEGAVQEDLRLAFKPYREPPGPVSRRSSRSRCSATTAMRCRRVC